MKKVEMRCSQCGSTEVRKNADCAWNVKAQKWEIVALFDDASCEACGKECKLEEAPVKES